MEKNTANVQKWLERYVLTDVSNMIIYGIIDKREGKGYYTIFYDVRQLSKWLAIDLDSEGFPALRIEVDSFLRAKVKSAGKQFDLNELEGREGNRGERFESYIAEQMHASYERDNVPYYVRADIKGLYGTQISCKFERATLARLNTIEAACEYRKV